MNNLQYYHGNHANWIKSAVSYTAVVQVPSLIQIFSLILDFTHGKQDPVAIATGLTFVNPKDQYCKATGRRESLKRCKSYPFIIKSIDFSQGRTQLNLKCLDPKSGIDLLHIEISPNWSKPHLMFVTRK